MKMCTYLTSIAAAVGWPQCPVADKAFALALQLGAVAGTGEMRPLASSPSHLSAVDEL